MMTRSEREFREALETIRDMINGALLVGALRDADVQDALIGMLHEDLADLKKIAMGEDEDGRVPEQ